ncbi:SDR family NAD(P)-dependent oxidoreductase [Sediminispirochaeta bajacaliforniensis]|uniref:SDR family NAD(P)-dependent oxidoreductase n=1 Tax=Sediminispirochaeta bajacaliforniensis TaxID=148 RepID=UPI00036D727C|nr:SDR family NAD(P)-dependent oxidoreductase [Sediminispirochaeta bajacaliforniensis]
MRYYIITGTSRGIGENLAKAAASGGNGTMLFCISRGGSEEVSKFVGNSGAVVNDIRFDLSKTTEIDDLVERIFRGIDAAHCEELVLINNAGVLEPVGPAGYNSTAAVEHHMRVNLLAPMRLTSLCIAAAARAAISGRKLALQIISGAAHRPYQGWSAYCAGKAGLAMFARTVALEQEEEEHPFLSLAVAPGIIDTRMQEVVRRSDPQQFPDRDAFVRYHEDGRLDDPRETASWLMKIINDTSLESGSIIDLREYRKGEVHG